MDKGYDYPQIWRLAVELGYRPHIRSRSKEAQRFKEYNALGDGWLNAQIVG